MKYIQKIYVLSFILVIKLYLLKEKSSFVNLVPFWDSGFVSKKRINPILGRDLDSLDFVRSSRKAKIKMMLFKSQKSQR